MKIILSESQYKRVILKESTEEDTKKWCKSNKHKVLEEIKQLWYDWAKSPKTKTRLIKSLETQSLQGKPGNFNDFLKKGVGALSPEVYANVTINRVVEAVKNYSSFFIRCHLKNEDDYLKRKDPVAYQGGGYITMNCSAPELSTPEDFKNVLLHEFTHMIDEKTNYINLLSAWNQPLPLAQQGHEVNIDRRLAKTVQKLDWDPAWHSMKNINRNSEPKKLGQSQDVSKILDKNTINDFKRIGISEKDLAYWLTFVADSKDYDCRQTEKEANLKTIRSHFCGNLTCNLTTEHLKKMMKTRKGDAKYGWWGNVKFIMKCWGANGFKPNFNEFLNGLNALARIDNNQNNITNDSVT